MDKKQENSIINKVINFPEKINNVILFFIIILLFAVVIISSACVLNSKEYNYEPEYEEEMYSDWVNTNIRVLNSYVLDDNKEISKNYRIQGAYYGIANSNYFIDYKSIATFVTNDGSLIYSGEQNKATSSTNLTTYYYANNTKIKGDLDKIYLKFEYTKYENNKRTNDVVITLKEEILKLTKNEIKMDKCNTFGDVNDVISSFDIRSRKESSKITFISSLNLNSENKDKYHIDLQVFGLDKDEKIYNLIGYYNLQNTKSKYFTHETEMTNAIEIDYVIVKCRILDEVKGERVVYIKKSYSDLTTA